MSKDEDSVLLFNDSKHIFELQVRIRVWVDLIILKLLVNSSVQKFKSLALSLVGFFSTWF